MDWFGIGIITAVLTAIAMAFGFWLEGRKPSLHIAILVVGFVWGLLVGAIMWLAFRLGGNRPDQRGLIYSVAIAAGAASMLLISYWVIGPSVPVGSTLGTGRIERPATGYAVTFPSSLKVSEGTASTTDTLFSHIEPEQRAWYRVDLYAINSRSDADCSVVDFSVLAAVPPAWTTVDHATDAFYEGLLTDESLSDQRKAYLSLPAGRVGHLQATTADELLYDAWIFTSKDRWLKIECHAVTGPGDGWRSVAESLRFDPA